MLPVERHRAILYEVNTRGSIRVKELSRMFEVTEETVRRDLDNLEHEGKLLRSYGGAIRIEGDQRETPLPQREAEHVPEKERIACEAATYVVPGDRIVLDASTTAWHLAMVLPNIPVTVVTNSMKVALELSSRDKIEVISTGGIVGSDSLSYVGPIAEDALRQFHVNKAFVSCKGLHSEFGLSESHALQALVKRNMVSIADEVFVLADHSKIQMRDFTIVSPLEDVDVLITDHQVSNEDVLAIRRQGVRVIQVS
ncbi:DeoR/GlpR transcriptional regulator [Alicyclobacillus cycloheptanicus]|uniref:DeoR/GlpR family transcriptional regulator of sugar metabolism n=1 Tax=Alicyclobacillus cycloheptanicus TaxID=1457 RepID=A0ABT9XFL3_9BACL|nr:DeoR/GlpR family DNA-binding transcription regulator [Alicyclobacillus cycloheptanicus]MDQ0189087.1 DeoR/GlpR family transcriptional regulator of sugar metabolism [Alicyclobacillus cycloheptanicus]WDM00221.1 DeoR/GlpR transcriptional regulator [Alicyclobacillus cycloheptanicus]